MDEWLADFGQFRVEFLRATQILAKAVGYYFEFDQKKLEVAHANWKSACDLWRQKYVTPDPESAGLSHLKIMAILLHQLAEVEWVTNLYEYDNSADEFEFNGTEEERQEIRADLNAARGTFLGYQFAMSVVCWFEAARIDRKTAFILRLTYDLEHDLMVYLLSEKRDPIAIFLILKALFARD